MKKKSQIKKTRQRKMMIKFHLMLLLLTSVLENTLLMLKESSFLTTAKMEVQMTILKILTMLYIKAKNHKSYVMTNL